MGAMNRTCSAIGSISIQSGCKRPRINPYACSRCRNRTHCSIRRKTAGRGRGVGEADVPGSRNRSAADRSGMAGRKGSSVITADGRVSICVQTGNPGSTGLRVCSRCSQCHRGSRLPHMRMVRNQCCSGVSDQYPSSRITRGVIHRVDSVVHSPMEIAPGGESDVHRSVLDAPAIPRIQNPESSPRTPSPGARSV